MECMRVGCARQSTWIADVVEYELEDGRRLVVRGFEVGELYANICLCDVHMDEANRRHCFKVEDAVRLN